MARHFGSCRIRIQTFVLGVKKWQRFKILIHAYALEAGESTIDLCAVPSMNEIVWEIVPSSNTLYSSGRLLRMVPVRQSDLSLHTCERNAADISGIVKSTVVSYFGLASTRRIRRRLFVSRHLLWQKASRLHSSLGSMPWPLARTMKQKNQAKAFVSVLDDTASSLLFVASSIIWRQCSSCPRWEKLTAGPDSKTFLGRTASFSSRRHTLEAASVSFISDFGKRFFPSSSTLLLSGGCC